GHEAAARGQAIGQLAEQLHVIALDLAGHRLVDRAERGLTTGLAIDPAELRTGTDRKTAQAAPAQPPDRKGHVAVAELAAATVLIELADAGRCGEAATAEAEASDHALAEQLDVAFAAAAVDAVVEA